MYVLDLPSSLKYLDAFEGSNFLSGVYESGRIVFQDMHQGQDRLGSWFSTIMPINPAHAEELKRELEKS